MTELEASLNDQAGAILDLALRKQALKFGEFKLTSGATSTFYFDGRLVTLDAEGAHRVATAFLPVLKECGAQAIAGPTVGADPIVGAVAALSYLDGQAIPGLIVRLAAKGHGAKRIIEGPVEPGLRVAVVDDACSTGGSLLHAIREVEAAACEVVRVMCILNRRQGGSAEIKRLGYDFFSLLEADARGNIAPSSFRR